MELKETSVSLLRQAWGVCEAAEAPAVMEEPADTAEETLQAGAGVELANHVESIGDCLSVGGGIAVPCHVDNIEPMRT